MAGTWVFLRFSPGVVVVEVEAVPMDGRHFLPWPRGSGWRRALPLVLLHSHMMEPFGRERRDGCGFGSQTIFQQGWEERLEQLPWVAGRWEAGIVGAGEQGPLGKCDCPQALVSVSGGRARAEPWR